MNAHLRFWLFTFLLTAFAAGCGCGGGTPVDLVGIEVTPVNPGIAMGTHQQFTATGIFSNNARQDITNTVTWSSSDISIATIGNDAESKGLAASHAVGSTTITAASGSISGSTTLSVTSPALVSITVLPSNTTIAAGTRLQFTATGTFTDGTTQDITKTATWSSSEDAIVRISNDPGSKGLATALTTGSTTISAALGTISGSTSLTITGAVLVSIKVAPENKSVQLHSTVQYKATGNFSDDTTQDLTKSVTWSSSDNTIATISNDPGSKGLATALGAGSTTITASLGSIAGSTSLTVTSVNLVSITVTPADAHVMFNTTIQYTATGTFSDNTTQDITTSVTWSSSDTSIATISNTAGSKGLATTGTTVGQTTITATLGKISGSTTLVDP